MNYIYFEATKEQLQRLIALAYNASRPMGLGMLHYKEGDMSPDNIQLNEDETEYDMDYVHGRMMKLYIKRTSDGMLRIHNKANPEYQSWAGTYRTCKELLTAAGIVNTEESDEYLS